MDQLEKTLLFDGYLEYFNELIPIPEEDNSEAKFPLVLCHNDAQENNLLMGIAENRQIMVIDYEYTGWNPMAMDLAHYLNETMLENAYPLKNGINWYTDNILEPTEVDRFCQKYLEAYFDKYMTEAAKAKFNNDKACFISTELANFVDEVYTCALLNSFFWGVWALSLLRPDQVGDKGLFNFDYTLSRIEMYSKVAEIQKQIRGSQVSN